MNRRRGKIILALVLTVLLAFTSACKTSELEQIDGIIQNIDSVNGKVTIKTKDGETITLDISTEASVETEGVSSTLDTLEVGASVQIEVNENNQVVQRIQARQAEVEGIIVELNGEEVTVESEDGQRTTVFVTESTRIESEDDLPALSIGEEVEIKYDPESQVAFTVDDSAESIEADEGTATEEVVDETSRTVAEGRSLAIVMGNIVAMSGVIWTIEQGGVIWVVDVGPLNLNGDWDVGDKITLESTLYGDTYIVDKAWLYPADLDDAHSDDHVDDGGDNHSDDGGDNHSDDGGDDHVDDGGDDHLD